MTDTLPRYEKDKITETPTGNELLKPGSTLLLASPVSLGAFGWEGTGGNPQLHNLKLQRIFGEYDNLFRALTDLVGQERMIVIENYILGAPGIPAAGSEVDLDNPDLIMSKGPKEFNQRYRTQDFSLFKMNYRTWPKNAFSTPGGNLILNSDAWKENIGAPEFKYIGDGGIVISHPQTKTVFITEHVKDQAPDEVEFLRSLNLNIGVLPLVNPKGRESFPPDDIDGFTLLVHNNGNEYLYVAKSYYNQPKARNPINKAVSKTGVTLRVIDDSNLPHLAFNAVVFDNGHTLIATHPDSTLHNQLRDDLGEDKLTIIPPLHFIATCTGGSAGCLSHILPEV